MLILHTFTLQQSAGQRVKLLKFSGDVERGVLEDTCSHELLHAAARESGVLWSNQVQVEPVSHLHTHTHKGILSGAKIFAARKIHKFHRIV